MKQTLLVSLLAAACASHSPAEAPSQGMVEIAEFAPASGMLAPGDAAISSLTVRNRAPAERTVWIGYSVRDAAGGWHDVPAERLEVPAAGTSEPATLRWPVPDTAPPGEYRVVMAVWDARPGSPGATRLASANRDTAFRVEVHVPPILFAGTTWRPGDHPLGRGRLLPTALSAGDTVILRLPPGSCDGAEIRTEGRYGRGTFTARIRTPAAPGSLSGFFLYEDVPGGNDELDVEIYNDGSRRLLLSTWVAGEMTNTVELTLPFEPSDAHHEYSIENRQGLVRFRVDGAVVHEFTTRLPANPMKLMVNAWWPVWLPCDGRGRGGELTIAEAAIIP